MRVFHSKLSHFSGSDSLPLVVRRFPKGHNTARLFHDHDFSELVIIERGSPIHLLEGGECPLSRGDILVVHPGVVHGYENTVDLELVNIIYDPARLFPGLRSTGCTQGLLEVLFPGEKRLSAEAMLKPQCHLSAEEHLAVERILAELSGEIQKKAPGYEAAAPALLMLLAVALNRSGTFHLPQGARGRIGEALNWMNLHYGEAIRIEHLAKMCCLSSRSFFRHFHECMGCSPFDYLLRLRLKHADELLMTTDFSISDIANTCGFCDSNFLCKQFHKAYGITPLRRRRQRLI